MRISEPSHEEKTMDYYIHFLEQEVLPVKVLHEQREKITEVKRPFSIPPEVKEYEHSARLLCQINPQLIEKYAQFVQLLQTARNHTKDVII